MVSCFLKRVHQHLLKSSQSGIINELTPSALYNLFVSICKRRLHIIMAYDGDNHSELNLFTQNECLIKHSFHLVVQVSSIILSQKPWPYYLR